MRFSFKHIGMIGDKNYIYWSQKELTAGW